MPNVHGPKFPPTAKQFCSGEDYGAYPLRDPDSAGPETHSSRRACSQPKPSKKGFNRPSPVTCAALTTTQTGLMGRSTDPRRNTAQGLQNTSISPESQ